MSLLSSTAVSLGGFYATEIYKTQLLELSRMTLPLMLCIQGYWTVISTAKPIPQYVTPAYCRNGSLTQMVTQFSQRVDHMRRRKSLYSDEEKKRGTLVLSC